MNFARASSSPYFNPRPPRGGRPAAQGDPMRRRPISIHALREEGDPMDTVPSATSVRFQSTPSARRATELGPAFRVLLGISIHALREEGDAAAL